MWLILSDTFGIVRKQTEFTWTWLSKVTSVFEYAFLIFRVVWFVEGIWTAKMFGVDKAVAGNPRGPCFNEYSRGASPS